MRCVDMIALCDKAALWSIILYRVLKRYLNYYSDIYKRRMGEKRLPFGRRDDSDIYWKPMYT